MKHKMNFALVVLLLNVFIATNVSAASPPRLAFSDLISGPSTGLGDGIASGVVVTIWGQNLGSSQSGSSIVFTNSLGDQFSPSLIYYWKNADGVLPGGPANLYKSHKMQEIAFSIPNVINGDSTIQVNVEGVLSNTLNFKVRDGKIFHVKSSGSNSSGDGSFNKPWKTINKALTTALSPGSTIYVHDSILTGSTSNGKAIYWNKSAASGGYGDQYAIVAFPNSQPSTESTSGASGYRTRGMLLSKIHFKSSTCNDTNGQPTKTDTNGDEVDCKKDKTTFAVQGTAFGRIVGNAMTDRPGRCASGQQGAIYAVGADKVEGLQILGNEIYDYGCEGSNKFHHTTYLSIRTPGADVDAWRMSYNYLHDNQAKNGLHNYDQTSSSTSTGECGNPIGDLVINDNVIVNQGGSAINVTTSKCKSWTSDIKIYNNIIINAGLIAAWNGINPLTADGPVTSSITIGDRKGGMISDVDIYHNTIYKWNDDDQAIGGRSCFGLVGDGGNLKSIKFRSNACITDKDLVFIGGDSAATCGTCDLDGQMAKISGDFNAFYFTGPTADRIRSVDPMHNGSLVFTNSIINDPKMTIFESSLEVKLLSDSPARQTSSSFSDYDIYGRLRGTKAAAGAVEFLLLPNPPSGLLIK